jgi:hypothetical protein
VRLSLRCLHSRRARKSSKRVDGRNAGADACAGAST